tara:strand:- start:433 stop:654 length:222 start_codon:yes stop_codon:yes gene_type:complete
MSNRYDRWQALTPEKREDLTQKLRTYKKLYPLQQRQLKERFGKFNKLPKDRQQQLREKIKKCLPRIEQMHWSG